MRFVFFTFKAHVAEVELFEDFFTLIKPLILKHPQYAYCIEKDNTVDRHLHMLVGDPKYTEMKQFKQKLNAKRFQDFKSYIKQGYQTNQHAFDTQLVPDTEEDIMKLLGYIYKEDGCIRRESTFSSEYIQDSYKLYYTSEKIKYKMRPTDWRYITVKNVHSMIEMIVNKYEEFTFSNITQDHVFRKFYWTLQKEGISTLQIKEQQLSHAIEDLRVRYTEDEFKEYFDNSTPLDESGDFHPIQFPVPHGYTKMKTENFLETEIKKPKNYNIN